MTESFYTRGIGCHDMNSVLARQISVGVLYGDTNPDGSQWLSQKDDITNTRLLCHLMKYLHIFTGRQRQRALFSVTAWLKFKGHVPVVQTTFTVNAADVGSIRNDLYISAIQTEQSPKNTSLNNIPATKTENSSFQQHSNHQDRTDFIPATKTENC